MEQLIPADYYLQRFLQKFRKRALPISAIWRIAPLQSRIQFLRRSELLRTFYQTDCFKKSSDKKGLPLSFRSSASATAKSRVLREFDLSLCRNGAAQNDHATAPSQYPLIHHVVGMQSKNFTKEKAALAFSCPFCRPSLFYCFCVASFCVFSFCVVSFLAETLCIFRIRRFCRIRLLFPFVMA